MQNSAVFLLLFIIFFVYPSTSFTVWTQFRKISTDRRNGRESHILLMSSSEQPKKNYAPGSASWKESVQVTTPAPVNKKNTVDTTVEILKPVDIVLPSSTKEDTSSFKSTSLAVKSNVELVSSVVVTVKETGISVASIVSSVAQATVSFTKSADGEESRQAILLAKDAIGDVGKNVATAWSVVSSDWKNVTKGMEDVEASEEYLGTMSKALLAVIKNPELKISLATAVTNVRRSLQEIATAAKIAVSGISKEVKYSDTFKNAVADASENFKVLFALLKEIVAKTVLGAKVDEPGLPSSKQ